MGKQESFSVAYHDHHTTPGGVYLCVSAKKSFRKSCILAIMKKKLVLTPRTSVADLLATQPGAIPVFLRNGMACVGCSMASFETLEDAARIYGINFETFYKEINKIIESS
jgi:hybrid cluster-associated redox disulfide protein